MSLINDALKQASAHQKKNPPPPASLQMRAAEELPRRSYAPSAILLGALLVALALGGVLIGYALQTRSSETVVNARHENPLPPQAEAPVVTPATKAESSGAAIASLTAVAPVSPALVTNLVTFVPSVPSTNAVAVVPVEPPKPVEPKLQGISYHPTRPSAVVDGRTVYAGDRVGELRVTRISPDSVTLAGVAGTKVLSLSQ